MKTLLYIILKIMDHHLVIVTFHYMEIIFITEVSAKKYDYEKPIKEYEDRFSIEEYEVFQIIKN